MEYSIKDVSEITGMKVRTIRGWISNGKIKADKDEKSRRLVISCEEVKRILSERQSYDANKN